MCGGGGGAYPTAKYSKTLANLQNPDPWGMRWGGGDFNVQCYEGKNGKMVHLK